MKNVGEKIKKAIDKHWADSQELGFRHHLGASVLGHTCARKVWYDFRWAYSTTHTGRILRLFERGQREEAVVVSNLRALGLVVDDFDVETGKQWRVKAMGGHIGGSADGIVRAGDLTAGLDGDGLLEIKTHNTKSFTNLTAKGVIQAKPEHFVQMQIYMHFLGLKWALYVAVNKNDDDLHIEVVQYKEEVAKYYLNRAEQITTAQTAPPRINESASWWLCKFCDYSEICHEGAPPMPNCRSCANACAVADGEWYCNRWKSNIPRDHLKDGCKEWEPIG